MTGEKIQINLKGSKGKEINMELTLREDKSFEIKTDLPEEVTEKDAEDYDTLQCAVAQGLEHMIPFLRIITAEEAQIMRSQAEQVKLTKQLGGKFGQA